jgi:hypothetical protein
VQTRCKNLLPTGNLEDLKLPVINAERVDLDELQWVNTVNKVGYLSTHTFVEKQFDRTVEQGDR